MRTSDAFMRTTTTLLLRRRRRFKDGRFVSVRARKKLNRLLRLHNAIKKTLAYTLSISLSLPLSLTRGAHWYSPISCLCHIGALFLISLSCVVPAKLLLQLLPLFLSLSWGTLVLTYLMPLSHWGSLSYLSLMCCSCYLHCCYTYSLSLYLSQSLSSSCGTPINSLSPAYAPF